MRYTKEQVSEWHAMYESGCSQKKIAKTFKIDVGTINRCFDNYGFTYDWKSYHISLSKKDLTTFNLARKHYVEDGVSINEAMNKAKIPITRSKGFTNYLKRTGVRIKSLSEVRKYVTNEDFFENIDTELKAYMLGFFAADGHIEKRKDYDSYTLRIGVSIKDAHVLKLFIKHLSDNKTAIRVNSDNIASIAITSKKIGKDLLELGFDHNKTKTWKCLPKINKEMMNHFIRGFFDGDGSISVDRRKSGNRLSGLNRRAGFTCYNINILKEINTETSINFNIKKIEEKTSTVKKRIANFEGCYTSEIYSLEDLKKLHDYLYKNATIYYKRKKDKFDLSILDINDYDATLQGDL